jgi:hypothetical protein
MRLSLCGLAASALTLVAATAGWGFLRCLGTGTGVILDMRMMTRGRLNGLRIVTLSDTPSFSGGRRIAVGAFRFATSPSISVEAAGCLQPDTPFPSKHRTRRIAQRASLLALSRPDRRVPSREAEERLEQLQS